MAFWKDFIGRWKIRIGVFIKWILFSVLIGLTVGGVGAGFHEAIEMVTAYRTAHDWLIWLMPVGGMLIVMLYTACGMSHDPGTNYVLLSVRENRPMQLRTAPLIIVSTVLTHLVGGSSGREGAALQLGSAIADRVGRGMRLDEKDERIITMCGMAAGFSALFGTPLAAAVFAMEVCSVGVMYYAAIFPGMLSAVIAALTAKALGGHPTAFFLAEVPELSFQTLPVVVALGAGCAVMAILFCCILGSAHRLLDHFFPNPMLRVAVGGAVVAALSLLMGTRDYNGAGMDVIARAMEGQAFWFACVLKMIFTALTLGSGFKGGEIVPAFFTGATFGCVAGGLLGLSPGFGAALGMVAVFCGVTNCPMTSVLLAYELFGGKGLPLFALCCAVSYMLSGYRGLYAEQKIMYSKYRAEFVGRRAGD